MRKNVAGQSISASMVSASDGSDFAGNVTCYVEVDDGGMALGQGTSPSGSCTYKGNAKHTYYPTQAETNGEHVEFTFVGSGAVTATINVQTKILTQAQEEKLAAAATSMTLFVVQSGATTTEIPTDIAEATPDHFKDRVMNFTTGALAGQTVRIDAYANGGVFTVSGATEAPDQGDEGVIT